MSVSKTFEDVESETSPANQIWTKSMLLFVFDTQTLVWLRVRFDRTKQ